MDDIKTKSPHNYLESVYNLLGKCSLFALINIKNNIEEEIKEFYNFDLFKTILKVFR